jgi:hypothetical protein
MSENVYREEIRISLERFDSTESNDVSESIESYNFVRSTEGLNFFEIVGRFEEMLEKFGFANTLRQYVEYTESKV